jgi:predicted secreted acid phosphatase
MSNVHVVKTYKENSLLTPIEDVKKILNYFVKKNKKACVVFDIDDTLIESEKGKSIKETQNLVKFCKDKNIRIFFITARLKQKDVIYDTLKELEENNILIPSEDLRLCPASYRTTFTKISYWKNSARQAIREEIGYPITFTMGDQWGDLIQLKSEEELKNLNKLFYSNSMPASILIRTNDDLCLWGLKILSDVEKKDFKKWL